ncbi:hypothetical protein [Oryzobacter terrae]|uniref:hypothetical protein n=1 Tax=Oryzobacter terrae TaxID=1620385 RepID=UPI00366CBDB0
MDQPTHHEALRRLEPLVGRWTFEASFPGEDRWPGGGTMSVEWHPSDAHLVQVGTVELPEAPANVSVIGCDGETGRYVQLYSDERGVSRVYEMSFDDGEWRLWRTGQPFDQRFIGVFSEDGDTISARWERSEDGEFVTDFDLVHTRVRD